MPISGGTIISAARDLTEATAENAGRGNVVLVQIELAEYGANPALALYLATRTFEDSDGIEWADAVAEPPSIDQAGRFLDARVLPNACDVELKKTIRHAGQETDETLVDLLVRYEWAGARLWIRQAFTDLTVGSSYPTIFDGEVSERPRVTGARIQVHGVSKRGPLVKKVPSRVLDLTEYPKAPKELAEVALPVLYGDFNAHQFVSLPDSSPQWLYLAGVNPAAFPLTAIEAESAGGSTRPTFLVVDHAMDLYPEYAYRIEGAIGRLARNNSAGTASGFGTSPTTIRPVTDYDLALTAVELDGANTSTDGQELLREDKPADLSGYMSLDYDAGKRVWRGKMPDIAELGTFRTAVLYLFYAKNLWTSTLGQWGARNTLHGNDLTDLAAAATSSATPNVPYKVVVKNIGPTATGGSNLIQAWSDIQNTDLEVDVKSAGQTFRGFAFTMVIGYTPAARVVRPGVTRYLPRQTYWQKRGLLKDVVAATTAVTSPDITERETNLYGYGRGYQDDASGTYTGTPSALIEHPMDVAHHALRTFGGVSSSEVVTGVGDFGSFVDARTLLSGYKLRAFHSKRMDLSRFLEQLSAQTLVWFRRKSTEPGAPFVAIPWDLGLSVNYRTPGDVFTFKRTSPYVQNKTFEPSGSKISDVVNSFRVNFDYDPRTNAYAGQLYITPTGSRVYSGGAYTTDSTREDAAAASEGFFGAREDKLDLPWVCDPATASAVLLRAFDLQVNPRLSVEWTTYVQAYDLEAGHVVEFDADWDDYVPFTKPGSDGSWSGKKFVVVNNARASDRPARYRVEAVEIA